MRAFDIEADIRFEGPAGPGHVTVDETGVVVRVSGWIALLRMILHLWRRPPGGRSPRAMAAGMAQSLERPVYLDAGVGPRLRIASPSD